MKTILLSPYINQVANSPSLPVRRSLKDKERHILECTGFDEENIKYLFSKNYNSPQRIVQSFANGLVDNLWDESEFSDGKIASVLHVAQYLLWYKSAHNNFDDIMSHVTEDSLTTFDSSVLSRNVLNTPMSRRRTNSDDSLKVQTFGLSFI